MKTLSIRLIIIALVIVSISPLAADDARIAALEAKVKTLETQNLSLKAAIEALAGKSLSEILTPAVTAADIPSPVLTPVSPPLAPAAVDGDRLARIAALKSKIDAAEKQIADEEQANKKDPFAEKQRLRMSAADMAKRRELQNRTIAEMKAEMAALMAVK